MSEAKTEFLERSKKFWNPGKTQDWIDFGDCTINNRKTVSHGGNEEGCILPADRRSC